MLCVLFCLSGIGGGYAEPTQQEIAHAPVMRHLYAWRGPENPQHVTDVYKELQR